MFRIDSLEKAPWRSAAIGDVMSVTGMRDGEGKAFWEVADPGDWGVLSTLRTKVTKPWGKEKDVGWGAGGGQRFGSKKTSKGLLG